MFSPQKVTLLTEVSRLNLPGVVARISNEYYQLEIHAVRTKTAIVCLKREAYKFVSKNETFRYWQKKKKWRFVNDLWCSIAIFVVLLKVILAKLARNDTLSGNRKNRDLPT